MTVLELMLREYEHLEQTCPQFTTFVNDCKGKTVEEIAEENGIDLTVLRNLIR